MERRGSMGWKRVVDGLDKGSEDDMIWLCKSPGGREGVPSSIEVYSIFSIQVIGGRGDNDDGEEEKDYQ